jgi:hypothetical protein
LPQQARRKKSPRGAAPFLRATGVLLPKRVACTLAELPLAALGLATLKLPSALKMVR